MKTLIAILVCFCQIVAAQQPIKVLTDIDFWEGADQIDSLSAEFETTGELLYKRFFKNTKVVAKEYLEVGKDSFLMVKYENKAHRIVEKGFLVPTFTDSRNDTLAYYDPENYEPRLLITKHLKLVKTGYWVEVKDYNKTERGFYRNNKRIGEWWIAADKAVNAKYIYYGENGEIMQEEPYNILDTQDSMRIAHHLIGACWRIAKRLGNLIELDNYQYTRAYDYDFLEFSADELKYTQHRRCSENRPPNPIGSWSINGDILSISGTALVCKKYKIMLLSKYELQLKEQP